MEPSSGGVEDSYTLKYAINDYDGGKMDRFDTPINAQNQAVGRYAYAYLERSLVAPYWSMATQYTLADRMFPTEWGPSFTAHLNLLTGTPLLTKILAIADNPTGVPWGCDAPAGAVTSTWNASRNYGSSNGPSPCYNGSNSLFGNNTVLGALDKAGISWKYYAPALGSQGGQIWTALDAFQNVACPSYPNCNTRGADWKYLDSPQTNVLGDISAGVLPAVSWVIPDWTDSDHNGTNSSTGPSWVTSVVNAVGKSKYWDSTAVIVLWDDWGGWYDNVPPPQLDFLGLGIRVPCIIISPYAKAHYVSHTQYEFGSVLKFVEETFNLSSLGTTDARANSLLDSFNFFQHPRTFIPISAPYNATHFLREKPSHKPPDDM